MKLVPVEFVLLFLCCLCGFGAISALVAVPVAAAGLLASSLPKYLAFWGRARDVGRVGAVLSSMGLSVLNALSAATAAYGMGLVMRLLETVP